jgi:hypothetical protein
MKLRRLVTDFAGAGGSAIEVVSGRQAPGQATALAQLAADFDLAVSVGSDFHADTPHGPRLGVASAPFADRPNVWTRLAAPASARAASRESTAP